MNRPYPFGTDVGVEVAILGGGLSGGLLALALAEYAPHLRVLLVEQDKRLAGNHTWCCHGSDLESAWGTSLGAWFRSLVKHRWSQVQVQFPSFHRRIDGEYLCIPSDALESKVAQAMARPGAQILLGERVQSASSSEVVLESGRRLQACLVLDARGGWARKGGAGFQKFLGWEIETDEPALGLGRVPTLMDATVDQVDGYRFVYVLPLSSTRFLVEDTYFSRGPVLAREILADRLRSYLGARGVDRYEIVREESGVLPMPWKVGDDQEGGYSAPVAVGYRAGLFHPATGYSLGLAAQTAERIARAAADSPPESLHKVASSIVVDLRAELDANLRFARALNFLAFRAVPGAWLRRLVFAAVYRLPPDLLARFYAARTTPRDRLALLGAVARLPWPRLALTSTHLNGETP
jgi:lycopene beta-cyclase